MALTRLSTANLSKEAWGAVAQAAANQPVGRVSFSPVWDTNYPVWPNANEGRYMFYIPNFQRDGQLVTDMPRVHSVADGSQYGTQVRCVRDLQVPEWGLDGSCPLCDAAQESTSWFFDTLRDRGIDIKDQTPTVRDLRGVLNRDKAVQETRLRYIFPAIQMVVGEDKKLGVGQTYWFDFSEKQMEKLNEAVSTFVEDNADTDIPNTPAGKIITLSYGSNKDALKADAVRDMTISVSQQTLKLGPDKLAALDKIAEDWTPQRAADTVKIATFYEMKDLKELAGKAVERMQLSSVGSAGATNAQGSLEGTPSGASDSVIEIEVLNPTDADFAGEAAEAAFSFEDVDSL